MAEIWFRGSIPDMSNLVKELEAPIQRTVWEAVSESIYASMRERLYQHIQTDVYQAYTPSIYPRRSDNGNDVYGTPLDDMDKNAVKLGVGDKGYHPSGKVMGVGIKYEPSGEHSGKFGDFFGKEKLKEIHHKPEDPVKPNPVSGNELIRRIETGKGYDWAFDMERPFWSNFVAEMVDGGGLAEAIEGAFASQGYDVEIDKVDRTGGDGQY